MDGQADGRTDGQADGRTDRQIDRRTDGRSDNQMPSSDRSCRDIKIQKGSFDRHTITVLSSTVFQSTSRMSTIMTMVRMLWRGEDSSPGPLSPLTKYYTTPPHHKWLKFSSCLQTFVVNCPRVSPLTYFILSKDNRLSVVSKIHT